MVKGDLSDKKGQRKVTVRYVMAANVDEWERYSKRMNREVIINHSNKTKLWPVDKF